MSSLIRATNLGGFTALVTELGGDPGQLLRRCGIAPDAETDADTFLPFHRLVALLNTCAAELACPDFGLRLSQHQGIDAIGPVAVIARSSRTVVEGLGSIAQFLQVHSPALRLAVVPGPPDDVRFTYEITELTLPELRQAYELSMGNAAGILRLLGGADAGASCISFLHAPISPPERYAEVLGCEVLFEQVSCGFVLPATLAARPVDSADPETNRIATRYLQSLPLPTSATLAARVSELAHRLLPTGQCHADEIARQLGLHPRTLQRRLAEEGTSCQDLVDRERRDSAARYLADPRFELSQVAALLGYAEQSTLNRACRRWFAATPRAVRAAADAGRSATNAGRGATNDGRGATNDGRGARSEERATSLETA